MIVINAAWAKPERVPEPSTDRKITTAREQRALSTTIKNHRLHPSRDFIDMKKSGSQIAPTATSMPFLALLQVMLID